MGEVLPFRRRRAKNGGVLCLEGHHKWIVVKERQFDVREGKLVTVFRCERCGAQKVKAL